MAKLWSAPFFIALTVSLAAVAQDSEGPSNCNEDFGASLLANQPTFKENGARVLVGLSSKDGVRMPLMCPSMQVKDFYLLTKKGPVKLEGSVTRKAGSLPWACGGELAAATLKPAGNVRAADGLAFVVHADKEPKFLKWRPAKPARGTVSTKGCAEMPKTHQRVAVKSFAVEGMAGTVTFETWQRKGEGCTADHQVQRVVQTTGQCRVLVSSAFDCDLMPTKEKPKLRGVYGILETSGEKLSSWMLFDAPGYEGEGVSAVPYSDAEGLRLQDAESMVYSGC